MSFLDFCFSSNWERERERERERECGIQNLGIKEKWPQSYLSYFSMVFHWRIFLLSRANRLYSIFFTLAWRTWGSSCLRYSFVFNPEYWLWFVCPLRTLLKNWTFLLSISADGGEPYFRFGVPANHLASFFSPLVSGDLRLLSTNIWSPLCDPHSFLTVTLWRLDTVNSNTRSSNFISLLPVGYHVTIHIDYVWSLKGYY